MRFLLETLRTIALFMLMPVRALYELARAVVLWDWPKLPPMTPEEREEHEHEMRIGL